MDVWLGKPHIIRMENKTRKKPTLGVDPTAVDWSKSSRELAAKYGVSVAWVWLHRRKQAPDTIPKPNYHKIDWHAVDWQQSSSQLAQLYGCGYYSVEQMRTIYAPGTPDPEIIRQRKENGIQKMIERCAKAQRNSPWANIDWSLPIVEIMRQTGATRRVVYWNRKIHAPETAKKRSIVPQDMDWSLSNNELAIKHNVSKAAVYNARVRAGKHKPKKHKPRS